MRLAVVVGILLLPSVAAGPWLHPGGEDAPRRLLDAEGYFDVEGTVDFAPGDGYDTLAKGSPAIVTPHGVAVLARDLDPSGSGGAPADPLCQVMLLAHGATAATPLGDPMACVDSGSLVRAPAAVLVGYDDETQRLWLCVDDRSGRPLRALALPGGQEAARVGPADTDALLEGSWGCLGPGWDPVEHQLCVPFAEPGRRARVALVDLDLDQITWSAPFGYHGATVAGRPAGESVIPMGCAVTTTGIVVTGITEVAEDASDESAATLFTMWGRDGVRRLSVSGQTHNLFVDEPEVISPAASANWLSSRAGVRGAFATFLMHDKIYTVDPSKDDMNWQWTPATERWDTSVGDVAWAADLAVYPVVYGLVLQRESEPPVYWQDPRGYRVAETAILDDGFVLILNIVPEVGDTGHAELEILRPTTRDIVQRLPLPGAGVTDYDEDGRPPTLTQLADGRILVVSPDSMRGVVVGPAQGGLGLHTSDLYPDLQEEVVIDVAGEGQQWTVTWGDGVVADGVQPPFTHRFTDKRDHEVVVTRHLDDGTTRTDAITVHTGADPPADLNPLQEAFADRNQDMTFGVLGIALTLLGALVAVLVRWRLRSRLAKHFDALDAIRERSRTDAVEALGRLAAFREGLRSHLGAGRLTDAQFAAVDLRARDALAVIRHRILGPLAGRLGPRFEATVDAAIADGHLSDEERTTLEQELETVKGLDGAEKARLQGLFGRLA